MDTHGEKNNLILHLVLWLFYLVFILNETKIPAQHVYGGKVKVCCKKGMFLISKPSTTVPSHQLSPIPL